MKKAAILFLILALLCGAALAEGIGDIVVRKGEYAAFLDGDGNIYITGRGEPVNATKAARLVDIDEDYILFFARDEAGKLIRLSLDGFTEANITDDAYDACLREENVYYISRANRSQVVKCGLDSGDSATFFTADDSLDRVYGSYFFLYAVRADGAGAYKILLIDGESFLPYEGVLAREIASGEGFEVCCTDSGELYSRMDGALDARRIEADVRAWTVIQDSVGLLCEEDGALKLVGYDPAQDAQYAYIEIDAEIPEIEPQLTSSDGQLFLLGRDNCIYSLNPDGWRLNKFTTLPAPESFALDGGEEFTGYHIEAFSGQLNVYGVTSAADVQPMFEFVPSAESGSGVESEFVLLQAYPIDGEDTTWDLLQARQAQGAEDSEPQASEAAEEIPEEASEEAGEGEIPDDGYYLPDPAAWLGNKGALDENDKLNNMDGYYISYVLNLEDLAAIEGYVELLKDERFGLKLQKEFEQDYASKGVVPQKFRDYCFDRRDGSVNPISIVTVDEFPCDVRVGLSEYYDRGICRITIYYASAFEFIDAGDVYAGVDDITTPSNDSSEDSEDSYSLDSLYEDTKSSRKKCSRCNGHGEVDCRSCNGKGYIEEYVSVPNFPGSTNWSGKWVRKDCTNIHCRDGKVECDICHGDGWID